MLQNAKVTAFTVFELLRENQQGEGVKLPPPTQIRVKQIKFDNVIIQLLKYWYLHYINYIVKLI